MLSCEFSMNTIFAEPVCVTTSVFWKKKNVYNIHNILLIVIEQLPFAYSFNTILHGGLMKFLLSFISPVFCCAFQSSPFNEVCWITCLSRLLALRAYVPSCLRLLDSYVSSCLKLFRVYVRSFFRCLLAYNDSQNILRLTSITCIAVFFWIIWPVVHFKTSKQTPASKTAYLNPILWDFVISTGACTETIIWGLVKKLSKTMYSF